MRCASPAWRRIDAEVGANLHWEVPELHPRVDVESLPHEESHPARHRLRDRPLWHDIHGDGGLRGGQHGRGGVRKQPLKRISHSSHC